MISPSKQQIELLHHTLGLTPERRESYRNYFVAGEGHHAQADLLILEQAGLMTQGPAPKFCDPGDVVFRVTDHGKALALDNLPPPPKYSRYEEYLRAECCESFAEWLGIDLPRREQSYNHRTPNHFRLKSSRATGDYAPTLKEAKASYKAALKVAQQQRKQWEQPA